ncbi:hypothetical protein L596_016623 [Steinernema carpocapsae]|uniref:Uncharacterized protein n=1 Tax=Steinernema carpocapsae TaxID=34508 RepID=A0A4U5NJ97_STECR|nr:hypothetical protein L596_016623 [Steinernema carpocapsae]
MRLRNARLTFSLTPTACNVAVVVYALVGVVRSRVGAGFAAETDPAFFEFLVPDQKFGNLRLASKLEPKVPENRWHYRTRTSQIRTRIRAHCSYVSRRLEASEILECTRCEDTEAFLRSAFEGENGFCALGAIFAS